MIYLLQFSHQNTPYKVFGIHEVIKSAVHNNIIPSHHYLACQLAHAIPSLPYSRGWAGEEDI